MSLRPILDYVNPNEPEAERKKKRLQEFSQSLKAFADAVENNQPFYPKEIYSALAELMELAHDEASEYAIRDAERRPLNEEYWKRALGNQKKIIEAVDNVRERIRERIAA